MASKASPLQILKQEETSITTIKLRSDGIVHVHMKDNIVFGLDEQREHLYACLQFVNGIKYPFMFTAGDYVNITKEARENAKKIDALLPRIGVALIVENLAYKLIAEFYQKFHKPELPTKIFSSEDKAVEWLLALPKRA